MKKTESSNFLVMQMRVLRCFLILLLASLMNSLGRFLTALTTTLGKLRRVMSFRSRKRESVGMEVMEMSERARQSKQDWLNDKTGIRVYQEGRNDGVFVFFHKGDFDGKPYDKIALAKFRDGKDGNIKWQARQTTKDGRKWWVYDFISIDRDQTKALADAIYQMVSSPSVVAREQKKENIDHELEPELDEISEAFDL